MYMLNRAFPLAKVPILLLHHVYKQHLLLLILRVISLGLASMYLCNCKSPYIHKQSTKPWKTKP